MSNAKSYPRLLDYLSHIVDAIERIQQYVQEMDESAFLADHRTQDAVIRNFEVIGEACNNVAPSLRIPRQTGHRFQANSAADASD